MGDRGPPDISNMVSLKVDNLSYRTTKTEVESIFDKYGKVGDVYIPRDRETKESRGFAFVRFLAKEDAEVGGMPSRTHVRRSARRRGAGVPAQSSRHRREGAASY